MRTREEQIIGCAQYLISMRNNRKATEYDLVECIIYETEQRVRAEIGRDSDRLDWLCRNIKGSEARRIVGVISDTGCVDLWRAAIDAAREVG